MKVKNNLTSSINLIGERFMIGRVGSVSPLKYVAVT